MLYKNVSFFIAVVCCGMIISCDSLQGPAGERGPRGPQGIDGQDGKDGTDLLVLATSGTIYNKHYNTINDDWAALWLPYATSKCVVLFVGIENSNGVYINTDWSSIIYSNGDDGFEVDGKSGYYVLILDPEKTNLNKNYQVRYIE